ncbi:MAG TPA: hypothetical protein VMY77_09880 [Chitinophagaceae bacterium]|nr:hypothetical protein [Chitinophagaceae bacterium]
MKLFVFLILIAGALHSCNETVKSESNSQSSTAKTLYEKNLASLQKGISAFENENIEQWAETVSDTTIWNSAVYGSSPAGKEDWKKALMAYFADWDSLKLNYPDFLPGIDSATHEFDGSVRYYGIWMGVHKSGVRTSVNMYATYDFNTEGKIVNASEFFDFGGLMNAIKGKEKKPAD